YRDRKWHHIRKRHSCEWTLRPRNARRSDRGRWKRDTRRARAKGDAARELSSPLSVLSKGLAMPGDRKPTAIAVYASQLDLPQEDVVDELRRLFGSGRAEEALHAMGGSAGDDPLSRRERSMIVISALIAQGGVVGRLRPHIRWAITNGVSR